MQIKVQQNEALISDNLFFNGGFESKKFYNAKPKSLKQANGLLLDNSLAYVFVTLDRESERYERVVYSFFDMFGYLGGLFDFAYFMGYLIVCYFNEKYLYHTIFSKLYQINQPTMMDNSRAANNRYVQSSVIPKSLSKTDSKSTNFSDKNTPI